MGLPPTRVVEHQITLKPNNISKNQYPYKSSHAHKDTIEKFVKEMLQAGIIQYSRSLFASPVILVKKKDLTWRLCVDDMYINKLTVKQEYPIPIIVDLLDELHGAKFFLKLT